MECPTAGRVKRPLERKHAPLANGVAHFPRRQHFFFSSRRRHTRLQGDWSSDVCSSDLKLPFEVLAQRRRPGQKLFKGRRVFFVFKLLRLVARIEVILKLASKIHFFKRDRKSVV